MEVLERTQGFFVVVDAWACGGVAWVEESFAVLACPFDFSEEGEDAWAAGGDGGVEHGVDAGDCGEADVEVADGEETAIEAHFDGEALAGERGGERGGDEVAEGVRDVGGEAGAVAEEEVLAFCVDDGWADAEVGVGVAAEDAALAFGELEVLGVEAERLDEVRGGGVGEGDGVSEEVWAEVAPAHGPEGVHEVWGDHLCGESFIDEGCVSGRVHEGRGGGIRQKNEIKCKVPDTKPVWWT